MKKIILIALFGVTFSFSNELEDTAKDLMVKYLSQTIQNAQKAKEDALVALEKVVEYVEIVKDKNISTDIQNDIQIVDKNETLCIEVSKTQSLMNRAKASMENIIPTITQEDRDKISSYLDEIERFKSEILIKIAKEINKIESKDINSSN